MEQGKSFKTKYLPFLWLLIGCLVFIFTRTGHFIPSAIIMASIFMLAFLRSQKPVPGFLLLILGLIAALKIQAPGIPDIDNLVFAVIYTAVFTTIKALVLALPYLADRLLYRKLNGFLSTLVFPVSATAIYFLNSKWGLQDGTAIFFSHSQYGNMSMVQALSIAGLWGMVFFLSWIAAIINLLWEQKLEMTKIKKGLIIFLLIAGLIGIYGGLKNSSLFYDYEEHTVRVATVTFPPQPGEKIPGMLDQLSQRMFSDLDKDLVMIEALVKRAVENKAKIVAFQEFSLIVPQARESAMIRQLQQTAQKHAAYICLGYVSLPKLKEGEHEYTFGMIELSDEEEGRNMALLINDQGEIVIDYMKYKVMPGEDNYILNGLPSMNVVDTPYGRIGVVVCRDMEFSDYMRKAGQMKADIMIAPSYEAYKAMAITYNQMLRAIEYGFSFIRPCGYGHSIAIDYHGKILAQQNYFTSTDGVMYADVPVKGITTLYTIIGDLFAWLCVAGFLLIIGRTIVLAIRKR